MNFGVVFCCWRSLCVQPKRMSLTIRHPVSHTSVVKAHCTFWGECDGLFWYIFLCHLHDSFDCKIPFSHLLIQSVWTILTQSLLKLQLQFRALFSSSSFSKMADSFSTLNRTFKYFRKKSGKSAWSR